jgi:hypothetical protein
MIETPPAEGAGNSTRTLVGWKAIAGHFGKSVRSVQRWELALNLPVHRLPEDQGGTVYADPDEIDAWRRSLDAEPASEPGDPPDEVAAEPPVPAPVQQYYLRWAVAALTLFALGTAIGRYANRPVAAATEFSITGRTLQARTATGAAAWSYTFEADITAFRSSRLPISTPDLDGDGEVEVVVPVRFSPDGAPAASSDAIFVFSRSGTLKWRVQPGTSLTFGGQTFAGPWELLDIVIPKSAAPRRAWFAFGRMANPTTGLLLAAAPGVLIELSPSGQILLRYAQAGPIGGIASWVTPAGPYLAITGSSPEHDQASLVLIRDDDPPATFASTDRLSPFHCSDCPPGTPRRILLFPQLELAKALSLPARFTTAYEYVPQLSMQYRQGPHTTGIVTINPDFSFDEFRFSNVYSMTHRQHERDGLLDHVLAACPHLANPTTIREWTPASGWRDQTIQITPSGLP